MLELVLDHLIELAFSVLTVVFTVYLPKYIDAKVTESKLNKYVNMLNDAVYEGVSLVKQTYVDDIKNAGGWTDENKEIAFTNAKAHVESLLSSEAKEFLSTVYDDVETLIVGKIQTQVQSLKNGILTIAE